MEKDKFRDILKIITYAVILVFLLFNLDFTTNVLRKVFKLILPFIIGIAIAFILNVILTKIEKVYKKIFKNKKLRRPICLILTILIVILTIFLIYKLVVPQVISSIELISKNLDNYINGASNYLNDMGISDDNIDSVTNHIVAQKDEILNYLNIKSDKTINFILDIASTLISTIINITVGFVFAIYLLLQKEKLSLQLKKIMNAYLSSDKVTMLNKITRLSSRVFSNFIGGQFIEAVIFGFLCFIGMFILKIPYATIISIIVGITALIPMLGAIIGTAIGVLFILVTNPIKTITFIIFIIILQQIEGNFIYPKVVGKNVGLPGIWVVVAITIGGSLSGLLGIILSVPIVSILYSLFSMNVNSKLKEKKFNDIKK